MRVMLIDDEEEILKVESLLLEQDHGAECLLINDSREVYHKVAEFVPDVVVTDIKMPYVDGMQILRKMRQDYREIPVIVMTGCGDVENMREAWQLGAFDFMSKPIDSAVFSSTVKKASRLGKGYLKGKSYQLSPELSRRLENQARVAGTEAGVLLSEVVEGYLDNLEKL